MSQSENKHTKCWCCDFIYLKLLACCSGCGQPNANVDFEAAQKAMQELNDRQPAGLARPAEPDGGAV